MYIHLEDHVCSIPTILGHASVGLINVLEDAIASVHVILQLLDKRQAIGYGEVGL